MIAFVLAMRFSAHADSILHHAHDKLKELLAQAVQDQAYEDVARIARFAEQVSRLLNGRPDHAEGMAEGVATDEENADFPVAPAEHLQVYARRARSRHRTLPRFERDRDRLVKVSWSKRAKAEYEHRAPRDVVLLLLEAIRRTKGEGALFETPVILPLVDNGREIPSYQAYLALAWLREEGIIKKKGRNGYILKPNTATPEFINELFAALRPNGE